jgi:hypothetical protein
VMSSVPTNYPSEAALAFEGRPATDGIAIGFSLANSGNWERSGPTIRIRRLAISQPPSRQK